MGPRIWDGGMGQRWDVVRKDTYYGTWGTGVQRYMVQADCVDEKSPEAQKAGTIKRESTNVDPGRDAAIAAVTNYGWANAQSALLVHVATFEVLTAYGITGETYRGSQHVPKYSTSPVQVSMYLSLTRGDPEQASCRVGRSIIPLSGTCTPYP